MQTRSSPRLFVGFSLNESQTKQIFHLQQILIKHVSPNSVATLAHNLHITLGFFGPVDPTTYPAILDAINKMPKPLFSQPVDTLMWWQAAHLVCLKGQATTQLYAMAKATKAIAAVHQLTQSEHDYIPHISLFRGVTAASLPLTTTATQVIIAPTHLHLYQSDYRHAIAHYSIVKSWPLQSAF